LYLSDLLARFDDVENTPDGYLVHCPAHDDAQQSLRLTVSDTGKVLARCRAGCATPKVMESLGLTMRDLATMTAGDVHLDKTATSQDVPADPGAVAALAVQLDRWYEALESGSEAARYASDRFGVSRADSDRLGLGYAVDAIYDREGNITNGGLPGGPRLVVPFRDKAGVARGFQARALAPDAQVRWLGPKSPDKQSWAKVGWFPGSAGFDEVIITEGPGDALTAAAALGFDTIGIRGAGLSANPHVIEALVQLLDGREAVIAGDGDPAGRRFSGQLADALIAHDLRVRILDLPDGLDLSDWRAADPAKFYAQAHRAIAQAAPVKSRTAALLAWEEDRYSLTDLGAARYLRDYIESLGSGVRYSEEVGFFLLEEGIWRRDDRQAVRTHAQNVADIVAALGREVAYQAAADGSSDKDKKRAARLIRYAAHAQTSKGLDAMLRELQAVRGVPANIEDFDKNPDLLAVANGVLNLRTGVLGPHDANLLLTKRVALDYDPNAKAPRWEGFLQEIFPSYPHLPGYIRRLVGYGITGHTVEQCFAVLWGKGANGKSVLTDTLTEVFRDHTVTTPFSTFEDRASGGIPNDLAALKGARLVMASEGEAGRRMAEAVLKRVTGRDMISARFMRKEFFEFRPTFLLMLATNNKPDFRGQDEGLWRRVKFIPFERFFAPTERDHRLGDKLLAEAQGILTWAVAGAQEWYREGLSDPEVVQSSTKEYRETSDALAGFMPGVFVKVEGGRTDGKTLFDAYLEWADEENLPQRERWTRRTFFSELENRGFTKRKTNRGVAFDGLGRARLTRHEPDHDKPEAPEVGRAGEGFLAPSAAKSDQPGDVPAITGADFTKLL
jgi:putative DNA primase/helicase